ncbi:MAG: MFS transporter [Candidatus Marsarchaeota archaeon]|jgi:MFS family permease|nr:MFS transporter [Candidatus Marsarchaeota archaeon]
MYKFGFQFMLISRATRSIGIIFMTLAAPLYLSAIGLSATVIGFVFFWVMIFNAALVMGLGALGDRIGYKPILLIGEILPMAASALMAFTGNVVFIMLAVIFGGIGGTSGGMRGSFSPGTTALIANNWRDDKERLDKLSKITSIAALFSIFGSLMLVFHGPLQNVIGSIAAFKLLFLVSAIAMFISFVSLIFVRENKRPKKTTKLMKKSSISYMKKVIFANTFNSIGIGVFMPLLPLWLVIMYHANTAQVGALFTIAYLFTSLGSYLGGKVRFKLPLASIGGDTRIISGILVLGMAASPFLLITAILYSIRQFVIAFGAPIRSAVNVKGVNHEDYGTASSLQGVANRAAQASSGISGYLMDSFIIAPPILCGILQIIGGVAYTKLLKKNK